MTTEERRTALLRAYGLLIDLATVGNDDEPADAADIGIPITGREEKVCQYAARIARGLPLRPGQRLTRSDRAELAQTDQDAPAVATPRKRAGRKSLASRTDLPFARRLNRDCRAVAERLAKRFTGGAVPVPAVVRALFAGEHDLAEKWAAHVRSLSAVAKEWRGMVKRTTARNRAK